MKFKTAAEPILETERLLLRKYRITDLDDYCEFLSQTNIDPMSNWAGLTTKKKAKEKLAKDASRQYLFAIVYKAQNKVIGAIELMRYKKEKFSNIKVARGSREISYLLHEKYWGQGIMPEALKAVVEYAFIALQVPEIVMCHAEANVPSGRVQEKLGFKIVDRTKNFQIWFDGTPTARIRRKMTQAEYLQQYVRTTKTAPQATLI